MEVLFHNTKQQNTLNINIDTGEIILNTRMG